MSKLARKIATASILLEPSRKGPPNCCFPLYGAGDLEDWQAIEGLRAQGLDWRSVQVQVDELAGIEQGRLPLEKFKYHWRRRCFCWPVDLRR